MLLTRFGSWNGSVDASGRTKWRSLVIPKLNTMSECRAFQSIARKTWRLLDLGRRVGKQLAEQTLTDLSLLEIRQKLGRRVIVHEFTRHQEAVEGADWEWWFISPHGRSLGFRVQAKVIDCVSQSFRHLHYRRTGAPYQCDTLISRSVAAAYHLHPIYCLYSNWRRIRPKRYWRCPCQNYDRTLWGCSLIPASVVRRLRLAGNKRHVRDLLPFIQPWHCLVCCDLGPSTGLADRAAASWSPVASAAARAASAMPIRRVREDLQLSDQDQPPGASAGDPDDAAAADDPTLPVQMEPDPPQHVAAAIEGLVADPPDEAIQGLVVFRG